MFRTFLATLFLRLISLFPLPVAHLCGRILGSVFYRRPNQLRKTAQKNISTCFPELSDLQKVTLIKNTLKQAGMAMVECGALWLWPVKRTCNLVKEVNGWELVEAGMAKKKGVILVMPHLGAWEMIALYSSTQWPMTSLYRPPKLTGLDQLIRKGRERGGATLVPTDANGVRSLRKALSRGELIGILPDQDPGQGSGVFAPFFGIQANTMTLLSRMAQQSGATVLIGYAERLPNGQGYHIHISSAPDCIADKNQESAAICLNNVMEKCARALPDQYQWGYKRFKTRPEGEKKFY